MSKTKKCPKCGGTGVLDHCGRCGGSGTVSCSDCGGDGEISNSCPVCGGRGKVDKTRWINCSACGGRGELKTFVTDEYPHRCGVCGGRGQVEDRYDDYCPNCNGTGNVGSARKCGTCNGTGRKTCPICGGTNSHEPQTCDRCDGTGQVEVYSSSSSSSSEGGWVEIVGGLLILIALCWGGWRGYKWLFGERGGSEVITEAEIMEKWQEHLEKRRDAFDDGLPEKEIEAKGLKNYTWDEWQEKFKKEHEAQAKQEGSDKTRAQEIGEQALSTAKDLGDKAKGLWQSITSEQGEDIAAKWKEHQKARMTLLNSGLTDKDVHEMGYDDYTLDEFKKNYDNIKYRSLEEVQQGAAAQKTATSHTKSSRSSSYKVMMRGDEAIVTVTSEYDTRQNAWQAAFRTAVKGAVSSFVGNMELLKERQDRFEECLNTVSKSDVKRYDTLKDMQVGDVFTVKIEARLYKKDLAPKFAKVFPEVFAMLGADAPREHVAPVKAPEPASKVQAEAEAKRLAAEMTRKEAEARARAEAESKEKEDIVEEAVDDIVGKQQNSTARKKPSKDSKGIAITVQGKGKTEDAALRYAIRQAVFRTVGTWVGSKTRIDENREALKAQMTTLTEDDVSKFEVLETQQQDGMIVLKVKVYVSKKKIAPKFAKIFPDVFGND